MKHGFARYYTPICFFFWALTPFRRRSALSLVIRRLGGAIMYLHTASEVDEGLSGDGQSREREEAARLLQMFGGTSRSKSIRVGAGRGEYLSYTIKNGSNWLAATATCVTMRDRVSKMHKVGMNAIRRLHGRRQCKITLRLASRAWA